MKKEQLAKDIENLRYIEKSIQPYSRWWRWGFLSSIRRAIKIMEFLKEHGIIIIDE